MTYFRDPEPLDHCPIWPGYPILHVPHRPSPDAIHYVVGAARAGGHYSIDDEAIRLLNGEDKRINDRVRASLTTFLTDMRAAGQDFPLVTSELINRAILASPMAVQTRADRLLMFISRRCNTIDAVFSMGDEDPEYVEQDGALKNLILSQFTNRHGALAWTESSTEKELTYVWSYIMEEKKWITSPSVINTSTHEDCIITPAGHARIAELSNRSDSAQAFVAMWLHCSLTHVYDNAIEPAIQDAGYDAVRIDRKIFTGHIAVEIQKQIRQSRFIVADVTHGGDGARVNVYLEVGITLGLDIPVIFTAEDGTVLPFDTSNYQHIFWSRDRLNDFRSALTGRILKLPGLGPGPRRT